MIGFKYIGNTALRLIDQGFEVPFGYEEAIGFMIENGIRDKDGVSATVSAKFIAQLFNRSTTDGFMLRASCFVWLHTLFLTLLLPKGCLCGAGYRITLARIERVAIPWGTVWTVSGLTIASWQILGYNHFGITFNS